MANSARKIDSVLKQNLPTNYDLKMDNKFKETYAKGWKLTEVVFSGWYLA